MSKCGCEFCSEGYLTKPVIHTRRILSTKRDSFPGIEAYVESAGLLYVVAIPDTYEPAYQAAEVKINFCPMCGRKFRED